MLCHWDDVPVTDLARGELAGRRRRLGAAAGAPRLGLSRYDLGPGERPMPSPVFMTISRSAKVMASTWSCVT